MGLLKILEDNGIVSSIDFHYNIDKEESTFGQVALVLFNDSFNTVEFIVKSLIDIIFVKPNQAKAMVLLAQFKGDAVIAYGSREIINMFASKFEQVGISVGIVPK